VPQGGRTERVGEEFREILAEEIQRLKDPRIGFVTVTGVKVSRDLRRAWVFYTSYGDDKARSGTRAALASATAHLRTAVGRQVRLKFLPELEFEEDVTLERGRRIDELIAQLHADNPNDEDRNDGGHPGGSGPAIQDSLERAAQVLGGATDVAIACHVNPDADALGAMLGLATFLQARGVATTCSFPNEPLDPPRWASMLPGSDRLVQVRDFPNDPAVMVTCDCAAFDRLGALGNAATRAGELIWIDHHRSNDGLGTVPVIDPAASSTCELVFRLTETMGGGLSDGAAMCLYAGLVTDTGRFQYEATTPETLRVAATLREHDFDHSRLVQALYEDNRPAFLRLLGTALTRLVEVPEADLVWTYLTQADLAGAGVQASETDDLIDVIRTARGTDVAALVKQQQDGRFKVSVRSRGSHDLAAAAAAFGGGGHRLAAGYTSEHGAEETIERLVAVLRDESAGR
jgi:bifunctional oligoribonuclease and PAP phosphatase NrnA